MSSSPEWPCAALYRAPLGPRTTMRVGGHAEWLLEPARPEELLQAWVASHERGFVPRVLGGGANLLIEDGLHPGVVISTERMARIFRPQRDDGGAEWMASEAAAGAGAPVPEETEPRLAVWAGAGLPGLVRTARDLGWSGLAGLVGVPGQLGGGVAMNAGGRWGEMWDVVESVRLVTPDGRLVDRARADCDPRYRDANLGDAVVVGAVLRLAHGGCAEIHEQMKSYLAEKSAAQPVTEHSCGCIFKNPDPELSDGRSAGQLIEHCGGKGLTRGPAIVSPKHGNFIVNTGGASATDVLTLIEDVQALVVEKSGVELEREVRLWRRQGPAAAP